MPTVVPPALVVWVEAAVFAEAAADAVVDVGVK
jgi:hypothetical protein